MAVCESVMSHRFWASAASDAIVIEIELYTSIDVDHTLWNRSIVSMIATSSDDIVDAVMWFEKSDDVIQVIPPTCVNL